MENNFAKLCVESVNQSQNETIRKITFYTVAKMSGLES